MKKHFTKLNLTLQVDPGIGEFITNIINAADADENIKEFDFVDLNTYYLEEYNINVLKYMNHDGTWYYGVFGNELKKYIPKWNEMLDFFASKGFTFINNTLPKFPEMICNNYGSVAHTDYSRNTGVSFIVHEDEPIPFCIYDKDGETVIDQIVNDKKWFVFDAKKLHGTGILKEPNVRAIVSLPIMNSYKDTLNRLEECVI